MRLRVVFRVSAEDDLASILNYIAADSIERAEAFVARIERRCFELSECPEAGRVRDDLEEGLRSVAFERRVLIVYTLLSDHIEIVRILYGGRDVGARLAAGN